jgi:hypothetical protein
MCGCSTGNRRSCDWIHKKKKKKDQINPCTPILDLINILAMKSNKDLTW